VAPFLITSKYCRELRERYRIAYSNYFRKSRDLKPEVLSILVQKMLKRTCCYFFFLTCIVAVSGLKVTYGPPINTLGPAHLSYVEFPNNNFFLLRSAAIWSHLSRIPGPSTNSGWRDSRELPRLINYENKCQFYFESLEFSNFIYIDSV
jgi:hypothetical protein